MARSKRHARLRVRPGACPPSPFFLSPATVKVHGVGGGVLPRSATHVPVGEEEDGGCSNNVDTARSFAHFFPCASCPGLMIRRTTHHPDGPHTIPTDDGSAHGAPGPDAGDDDTPTMSRPWFRRAMGQVRVRVRPAEHVRLMKEGTVGPCADDCVCRRRGRCTFCTSIHRLDALPPSRHESGAYGVR